MRLSVIFLFLSMLGIPPVLAQEEASEPGEQVLLILDSSGSMWGQIDERAKYEIARDVIDELLAGWDASNTLGLMAYGHRREGDCTDIEMLAPLGAGHLDDVANGVSTVRPLGKTAITAALRQGAAAIEASGAPGSIILLTDGLETCSADPCAAAAELAASGINLRAHVIGFDLGDEDLSSLRCIADETGGMFLTADTAGELSDAMGTVMESAVAVRNVTLRAVDGAGDLLDDRIIWNVYDTETDTRQWVGIASEASFSLAPGNYRVQGARGDSDVTQGFDVPEDEAVVINVMFATGTVQLSGQLASELEAFDGRFTWTMSTLDGEEVAREAGSAVSFTLPAGLYQGRVAAEDLEVMFDANIVADEAQAQVVDLNAGQIHVTGLGASGAPTERHVSWTVFPAGVDGARAVARETRRETTFLLTAGQYVIIAAYQGEEREIAVDLLPGADISETVNFTAP